MIYRAGVSTRDQVTDISGRGIGMDAVKTFLEENGGNIDIELNGKKDNLGFRPFRFIIYL